MPVFFLIVNQRCPHSSARGPMWFSKPAVWVWSFHALNLSHLPFCLISAREGSLLFKGSKMGMWTLLLFRTLEGQAEEFSESDLSTCLRKMVESVTQEVSLALPPITLTELSKIFHNVESTKDKMLDADSNLERRIFLSSKITADPDCNREIRRHLLLGRKAITNLDSVLKSRDITLLTKIRLVKATVFPVVMYGCESWTVKKAEH